jgi:hypothetical protein
MSPHRAELSGLLEGLYILKYLLLSNNITTGSAFMCCDCEKAIKVITHKSYKGIVEYLSPDSDLVQEAKYFLRTILINITIQWVEGHYSGDAPTLAQTLNHKAHNLAKKLFKKPTSLLCSFYPSHPPSLRNSFYHI